MPLPKPVLPIFSLIVPSTGKKVSYRQFTVKEEKMMAQAKTSEDLQTIVNSVKEVIRACVNDVNVDKLAIFDVEYIITKIRAKSVGEAIDLKMICENDKEHAPIPVRIDLDKIEVKIPENHHKTIELFDGTGVVLRYPTLDDLIALESSDDLDKIVLCLESIYTPDEVFEAKDQTKQELRDYLESLTENQLEKIEETFFRTMPVFHYVLTYKCSECGHEHKKVIRGLASFFD